MATQKYPIDSLDIPHPFNTRDRDTNGILPNEEKARVTWECDMCELSWTLRQKPNWHEKIKDLVILGKWRKEVLDQQVDMDRECKLTHNMIDYVLKELDNYAKLRDVKTGIEHACDDSIFWCRNLIALDLTSALRGEVAKLENIPDDKKDWHPNSNNQVLDLVHPSLYPIVYGRTYIRDLMDPKKSEIIEPPETIEYVPEWFTSTKFCWLPSDFHVSEDGTVKLISPYINNIHPSSTTLMDTITSIISRFVPMWERVLGSVDRHHVNYTPKRLPGAGEDCIWINDDAEHRGLRDEDWEESEYNDWPGENVQARKMNWLRSLIIPRNGENEEEGTNPRHVGSELSEGSEDADSGIDHGKIEIKLPDALPPSEFKSAVEQDWRVADLRNTTLQVIVKLANIELMPENPEYAGGSWHVEGMLNERIVSTGIYYYDSENITNSHLAFRCCISGPDYHGQSDAICMEWLYNLDPDGELVQARGQVPTNQGTCLAFPNIYQHCVSPFKLEDPTKPGHRKILALFLVDPAHSIPSASSVLLQRQDWVVENVHGATMNEKASYLGKLPVEVKQLIIEEMDGLMSWEDAVRARKELIEERKEFVGTYNGEVFNLGFNMCER